ncbi:MAG: Gfo/Idh/MocA family protein [Candidatus Poribacteria bacterium]
MADIIRGAVIGYGAAFNMGKHHASQLKAVDGLDCIAICDTDQARTKAAKTDFPDVKTYNNHKQMLEEEKELDLCVVVLPHYLHAPVAMDCLKAGKHVIIEKPMCITIAEATEMINTAREKNLMLTVFHNRRWDADFWTLKELVNSGVIGKIFHVEMWGGGYGHPGKWWRADKKISGGAFYDWGAHYLDWLLNIIPSKMVNVTGYFHQNRVWKDVTNEDHVEAVIRFEDGSVANVQMSQIAKIGKPRWRVLGEKGAIISEGDGFKVLSVEPGFPAEQVVKFHGRPGPSYYQNIAAHLLRGEELIVKPEEARRVIAVMDLAEKSSKSFQSEPVPYEHEFCCCCK